MVKYIKEKQIGNRGEAFFESLISEYALVHKIDSSKDVGLDFLCEWVYGEKLTQLLFGVQVKTTNNKKITLANKKRSRLNLLMEYKASYKIKEKTLKYWSGFDFPVFLFLIKVEGGRIGCYYKRYTSILHGKTKERNELFYKVNDDNKFIAFKYENGKDFCGGFCRDLFFDHLRCQHNKGMLSGINPQELGLTYWRSDTLYEGVYDNYKEKIKETIDRYNKFKKFLN